MTPEEAQELLDAMKADGDIKTPSWSNNTFLVSDNHVKFIKAAPEIATAYIESEHNLQIAVEALNELSRLGNGPHLGNSDGNVMAQKALDRICR